MSIDANRTATIGSQHQTPKPGDTNTPAQHSTPAPKPTNTGQPQQTAENTTKTSGSTKPAAKKPRRRSRAPQRATPKIANEVIQVVRDVESAEEPTRKLAATLFNIDNDIDTLAASIATVDKDTVGVVTALIELRDQDDPVERMIAVSTWDDKKTTNPAWRFLHALDLVSRQMPGNDTKTAAEFTRVLDELPEELDKLEELLS